jgi:hypothetical protein
MKKMSLMVCALLLGATVSVCNADAFTSKQENMIAKITDKADGTKNPKAKEFAKKKIDCVKAAKDEAGFGGNVSSLCGIMTPSDNSKSSPCRIASIF